ncbi:MAG: hypothetical protein QME25_09520 [Bacteroidota bacterium]|nr:hypothetical protein [Bacteroidota bacterium]
MKYVSGVSGAGQIFHDVIMLLESYKPAKNFVRPKAIKDVEICINSGKLAGKLCVAIIIEDVNLKAFNRLQNKH